MTESFGIVSGLCKSVRDTVFSVFKPVFDCIEPVLDLTRPTCGPALDLFKNLVSLLRNFP